MRRIGLWLAAAVIAAFAFGTGPSTAGMFLDEIKASLQDVGAPAAAAKKATTVAAALPSSGGSKFRRQTVRYETGESPGTIVIDPKRKFLYFVVGGGKAIRYGIGVGRDGFGWSGRVYVGKKAEWPAWRPPPDMIERARSQGRKLPEMVEGGPGNPLGARALYLYRGFMDTTYRIHGTGDPSSIGRNVSSGCFRLINSDVIDLYNRAQVGARVVVL